MTSLASSDDASAQLSRSFALSRWFGIPAVGADVDAALLDAMASEDPLGTFASKTNGCVVANGLALGDSRIEVRDGVAIVRPGRTPIVLPPEARAVAVDLRDIPGGFLFEKALGDLAPAIVQGEWRGLRVDGVACDGLPYELEATPGLYKCFVSRVEAPPVVGTGPRRPLAVLTAPRLSPEAARFAIALRLANQAWLVGDDVSAAVGEMTAATGKERTAYTRTTALFRDGVAVPDLIPADEHVADPTEWLRTLPDRTQQPPPVVAGAVLRPTGVAVATRSTSRPSRADVAATKAALVGMHAAVRTFFPYFRFGVVPDTWDEAFVTALGRAGEVATVRDQLRLLREMSVVLEDSHALLVATGPAGGPSGFAALDLVEVADDDVVVTRTAVPGIERGDRVVAIGGLPTGSRIADEMTRISGSTAHRRWIAVKKLLGLMSPTTFSLERGGVSLDVEVPLGESSLTPAGAERAPGDLADLGADDTYYVSLDADDVKGKDTAAIGAAARSHRAVVLDMRGYPGPESWRILAELIPITATGPEMRHFGANPRGFFMGQTISQTLRDWAEPVATPPFAGPIAILVEASTQSQAEHLLFFAKSGSSAKLVGHSTSGANGNVTGLHLASGVDFKFTGMEVRFPGGGRFHGIGITPDVQSSPTRADIAAGRDTQLLRAIEVLRK